MSIHRVAVVVESAVERFPFHRVPGSLVYWDDLPCLVLEFCAIERSTRNLKILELDAETPDVKHVQWVGERRVRLIPAEDLESLRVTKGVEILKDTPCRINSKSSIGMVRRLEFRNGRWTAKVEDLEEPTVWLPLTELRLLGLPNPFVGSYM